MNWSTMVLMVFFSSRISPFTSTVILRRKVASRDRRCHFGDIANLCRKIGGQQVDVVGQVLPRSRHAGHDRLSAKTAIGADFAGHARHFGGEGAKLVHHRVERFL